MFPVVLAARPVINAAYHARLERLGLDPNTPELNPPPVPGSVQGACRVCNAPVWIGPEQQKRIVNATWQSDAQMSIECLLCTRGTAAQHSQAFIVSLSDVD
jgi:hypothetical protein